MAQHAAGWAMGKIDPSPSIGSTPQSVQRQCAACDGEERGQIQAKPAALGFGQGSPATLPVAQSPNPFNVLQSERPAVEQTQSPATLLVGAPNDPLEHEADRFAEQVMRWPVPPLSRNSAPLVQRDILDDGVEQAEHEDVDQAKALPQPATPAKAYAKRDGTGPAAIAADAIPRHGGRPLEAHSLRFFQERTGFNFSGVRIHADGEAAASASRLVARAFTVGSNIYFNRAQYRPESHDGRMLLAHELAHVVQQGQVPMKSWLPQNSAVGVRTEPMSAAAPSIQRQLLPPGNCIQGIHDAMQSEVKAWCDHPSGRACTTGESCPRLLQKIRRNQMCARSRRIINDTCYAGGDSGHRIAELDARRAQANCMAIFRATCMPQPVPVPKEQPDGQPKTIPQVDQSFLERMAKATGLTGAALIVYLIISEGSRIVIPPRNLVPVP